MTRRPTVPRWDVLLNLRSKGWKRGERDTVVTKGDALYASWSSDSGVDGHRWSPTKFSLSFSGDVPDEVIVAVCEAVAKGHRGRAKQPPVTGGSAPQPDSASVPSAPASPSAAPTAGGASDA